MLNDLQGGAQEYNFADEQKQIFNQRLLKFKQTVPLKNGALKTIRDKISSHVDKKVFAHDPRKVWELVDIDLQLEWLRLIIVELMFLLSLDIYAWTRESGHPDVFRLMSADGVQVDFLMENKSFKAIVAATMTASPKYYISNKVLEVDFLYKRIKAYQVRNVLSRNS